jgi:hypothetical protein
MEITVEGVKQNQIQLFEELAKALGLKIKKNNQPIENQRDAIKEAIDRIESGNAQNINIDLETLRSMVYEKP